MSNKKCFIISKFGDDVLKDLDFKEANAFFAKIKIVLQNAVSHIGDEINFDNDDIYNVDDLPKNDIKNKIFENIISADLVIANLQPNKDKKNKNKFYFNGNVMYETALRHSLGFPILHFIERTFLKNKNLPFDISGNNTIPYSISEDFIIEFDENKFYKELKAELINNKAWGFSKTLQDERKFNYNDFISGKSNIIAWKKSQILQQEAEDVYSITSNLNWIINSNTFNGIIENIIRDKDKPFSNRHYFIFIKDDHPSINNDLLLMEKIEKRRDELKTRFDIDIDDHFRLISISKTDYCAVLEKQCTIDFNCTPPMIPKPVDIVLYRRTICVDGSSERKNYMVMSIEKVGKNYGEEEKVKNYDVIFGAEHYKHTLTWFSHLWYAFTNDTISIND